MLTPKIADLSDMVGRLRNDVEMLKRRSARPTGTTSGQYAKFTFDNPAGSSLTTGAWTRLTSFTLVEGDDTGMTWNSGLVLPPGRWQVHYNLMGGSSVAGATLFVGLAQGLSAVSAAHQMITGFTSSRSSGMIAGSFSYPIAVNTSEPLQVWFYASAATVLYHHYLSVGRRN